MGSAFLYVFFKVIMLYVVYMYIYKYTYISGRGIGEYVIKVQVLIEMHNVSLHLYNIYTIII